MKDHLGVARFRPVDTTESELFNNHVLREVMHIHDLSDNSESTLVVSANSRECMSSAARLGRSSEFSVSGS